MLSKLIKLIPTKYIIYLWKNVPFPLWFRNFIIWRANCRFLVAVMGIITNEKNQLLLVKHTYRDEPWGVPSGWIEYEQPFSGLEREVLEETGLTIKADSILSTRYVSKPNRIDLIVKGSFVEGTFRPSAEVSDYGFFDIGNWPQGMPEEQQLLIKDSIIKNI